MMGTGRTGVWPIEELLRWAYRDELPKERSGRGARLQAPGFGHAWGSVTAYGELLAVVDDGSLRNAWGVVMFADSLPGEPHPDAVAVAEAVLDLDGLVLDLPDPWEPLAGLGDMGGLGPSVLARALERISHVDASGERRLKLSLRELVYRHAVIGGMPVWETEVPQVRVVLGAKGRPRWFVLRRVAIGEDAFGEPIYAEQEFDGMDARGKRVLPGAYQKTWLDPDPVDAIVCRAEWEIWRAALDVLACDLDGRLRDHPVVPSRLPYRPWEEAVPERQVLRDLGEAESAAVPETTVRRHYAERGPLWPRSAAGLVLGPG